MHKDKLLKYWSLIKFLLILALINISGAVFYFCSSVKPWVIKWIWPKELMGLYVVISRLCLPLIWAGGGTSCRDSLYLSCLLQKMINRFLNLEIFVILKSCLNLPIKYVYPTWGYLLDCKWSFLVLKISAWFIILLSC